MNTVKENDPLGYLGDVEQAMDSPVLKSLFSPHSQLPKEFASTFEGNNETKWPRADILRISFPNLQTEVARFVSAVGFCRLYGIKVPYENAMLIDHAWPREILVTAVDEAISLLKFATESASSLPQDFDQAEALEDRDYCTSMLFLMMKSWAMFVVIDEQYQLHLDTVNDFNTPFSKLMNELFAAKDAFDVEVQQDEQMCLIAVATELPLLENWRNMLTENYAELLPWWLDGTLEKIADTTQTTIEESFDFFAPSQVVFGQSISRLKDQSDPTSHQQKPKYPSMASNSSEDDFMDYWKIPNEFNRTNKVRFANRRKTQTMDAAAGKAKSLLLDIEYKIDGDPSVPVRLDERAMANGFWELIIALGGDQSQKYLSVVIEFDLGDSSFKREAKFVLDDARFQLTADEAQAKIRSITLLDSSENQRRVIER